ncbi:MAG: hypothetical protein ACYTBJ_23040 [Planctomycetota bacterium]|jgi:hypothetical protein
MYSGDNDGRMPHLKDFDWITPLYKYYGTIELLLCPSASKADYVPGREEELVGGKFRAWVKWREGWHCVAACATSCTLYKTSISTLVHYCLPSSPKSV